MTLAKLQKIINMAEGAGTYVLDTPLAFYNISTLVNSFDWSGTLVSYNKCRVVFKANGLYYIILVHEVPTEPDGVVGTDYDIINGKYWIYMKPRGNLTYDIFSTTGIGAVKLYPSVRGGVI